MLTVFLTLVRRPTLSKMATRALKAPWSQADQFREDIQHGLSPLSVGGRKLDRSGVQSEADGVGENLCRETKRESGVRGVWGRHQMTQHASPA